MLLRFTYVVACIASLFLFMTEHRSLTRVHPSLSVPRLMSVLFFPVLGDGEQSNRKARCL